MSYIDPTTGQVTLDPYAGQPIGGGVNNIPSTIGALTGQSANAASSTGSSGFNLAGLLRTGGEYYLGKENIEAAQRLGRETQAGAAALAEQARAGTEFKPYTVTGGLANIGTTAEGGFDIGLSPEQQAMQNQLMGQAGGLFGQVGQDPAQAQAALYEQMRGVQAEQLQAGQLGGLLQGFGYQPQQQALSMLTASQIPAGYADIGRRTGTELSSQMGLGGLESRMQAEDLANRLQLQQGEAILGGLFGQQATAQEQILNKILGGDIGDLNTGGLLTSGVDWLAGQLGF